MSKFLRPEILRADPQGSLALSTVTLREAREIGVYDGDLAFEKLRQNGAIGDPQAEPGPAVEVTDSPFGTTADSVF